MAKHVPWTQLLVVAEGPFAAELRGGFGQIGLRADVLCIEPAAYDPARVDVTADAAIVHRPEGVSLAELPQPAPADPGQRPVPHVLLGEQLTVAEARAALRLGYAAIVEWPCPMRTLFRAVASTVQRDHVQAKRQQRVAASPAGN